jgi:hypothetical protein
MKFIAASIFLLGSTMLGQTPVDNSALTQLFTVDQNARKAPNIDWVKLTAQDEERRKQVHQMLETGEIRTANDYFHAALIYQHGQKPEDFLLAHALAVDAISLGGKNARWLAAATLDRYLRSISKPQIYGTQFEANQKKIWTQQTLDPSLVTDSVRAAVCVVPAAEQTKILQDVNKGAAFRSTNAANYRSSITSDCE